MASAGLCVGACSLHGARDLSGGHLTRQVSSLFTRTFGRGRYFACAAPRQLASSAFATSMTLSAKDLHTQQAWEFWRKLGLPKYHVAPMVDQVPPNTHVLCGFFINCILPCSLLWPHSPTMNLLIAVRAGFPTVVPKVWSHRSIYPNAAQQAVSGRS